MKINVNTTDGGAVEFNKADGAWASYRVAGVADLPKPPILFAGIQLKDGRSVQFFFNRDTNLAVVDVINKGEKGGREVLRMNV